MEVKASLLDFFTSLILYFLIKKDMKLRTFTISLLLFGAGMVMAAAPKKVPLRKYALKVLYVGGATDMYPDTYKGDTVALHADAARRTAAFRDMLSKYFTTVRTMNAENYTQQCSEGYDVTIMDGTPGKPIRPRIIDRAKQVYSPAAYLTEDFSLPMLTIGSASETVGRSVGCKNDWYCLCLDADAHSWKKDHPIFKGPFAVRMTVKEKPTPEDAFHYAYFTGPVPKTLPMWRVQTEGYKDHDGLAIGMVSRPWGYLDSPEAEYISSGVCAKTLDAVAIGRHGNFLHWGFAASPLYMTDEAKAVFANAVVYISKFKGQGIIARKYNERQTTLEYLKEMKYMASDKAYDERLKSDEEWTRQMLAAQKTAQEKQARGETLDSRDKAAVDFKPEPPMTREQFYKRYMREWYDRFGNDRKAFAKYLDDNRPYLYGGEGFYQIKLDDDCKALGIDNHDLRLLDTAIGMLESHTDEARALRLLARYTLCDFGTAAQWRKWFNDNKSRLFFSESAGWVWLVNSRAPGANDYQGWMRRKAVGNVTAGETSDTEPVAVSAARSYTETGDQLLIVRIKIHPGYHIYAYVPKSEAFTPTTVKLHLPGGMTATGDMKMPQGRPFTGNIRIYEDEVVFTQTVSGTSAQPASCDVTYQCCDDQICFPPTTKKVVFN